MTVLAWKFLSSDHELGFADGRAFVPGETLRNPVDCYGDVVERPVLCEAGFHASLSARDCLQYASGMTHIARVELGGEIVYGDDKLSGMTIKCLWIADAEKTLRLFAISCLWRQMGYRLRGREPSLATLWALDCAERFVLGETDREELEATRAAAAYAYTYADDTAYAYTYADAYAYAYAYAAYAAYADAYAYAAYAAATSADAAAAAAERRTASEDLEARLLALEPR